VIHVTCRGLCTLQRYNKSDLSSASTKVLKEATWASGIIKKQMNVLLFYSRIKSQIERLRLTRVVLWYLMPGTGTVDERVLYSRASSALA
jgi:hypothetical protein